MFIEKEVIFYKGFLRKTQSTFIIIFLNHCFTFLSPNHVQTSRFFPFWAYIFIFLSVSTTCLNKNCECSRHWFIYDCIFFVICKWKLPLTLTLKFKPGTFIASLCDLILLFLPLLKILNFLLMSHALPMAQPDEQ